MKIDSFLEIMAKSKIAKYKEYLCQTVRPAIDIIKNRNEKPYLGCSRFGGTPDLPVGSEWPTHDSVPYRFLGQINFADLPLSEIELPSSGLLSLFVADDPTGECYLEVFEDEYLHTIYIPELTNIENVSSPNTVFGKTTVVKFCSTIDIPYDEYQIKDWPFDEEETDDYNEIRSFLHESDDYLLGYPSHCTLAYNPTPGTEWVSLLTIGSDNDLEWCWHDGDKLMIFIERERLKNSDFSSLKADAG
jgi:uncharacterized protein YwqG